MDDTAYSPLEKAYEHGYEHGKQDASNEVRKTITQLAAERDVLRTVLAELYNSSLSDQETRLLMVVAGGSTMANPDDETGQFNHARCDRINKAREQARAALAKTPAPAVEPTSE